MPAGLRNWFRGFGPRPAVERADGELVTAFATFRDDEAFAELVRRHGPMVLAACRRVLHPDTHAADDAFQAAFLVLATKADAVRPPGRVGAFLHGVAVRVAKRAKAWGRKVAPLAPADLDRVPAAAEPDPDLAFLRLAIDDVLAGLPAKYRSPVVLCDLEGRSRAEAAGALGWTEGTLSGRLARARKLLADRLTRRGFALPAAGLAAVLPARPAAALVPPHLVASTERTAALVAAGVTTAEVTSDPVARLAHGVHPPMTPTFKVLAAGVAGIGLALGGFGLLGLPDSQSAAAPASPLVHRPAVAPVPAVREGWVAAHVLTQKNPVTAVAFGPGPVAVGDAVGNVALWDAKTGEEKQSLIDVAKLMLQEGPTDWLGFTPDGTGLHVVRDEWWMVAACRLDPTTGRFAVSQYYAGPRPKFWAVSPDGKLLLRTGLEDTKEVQFFDNVLLDGKALALGTENLAVAGLKHPDEVVRGVMSDDSKWVATLAADGTARLWDYAKEKELWSAKPDKFEPVALALAPGGKSAAVAGKDGTVRLFDGKTGTETAKLDGHAGTVNAVAFSPDGKRVVSGGADETARVYDAETGKELAVLKGHTDAVTCVAFGPDGNTLATGSTDKTVKVWELKK